MASAKDIHVAPISSADANKIVKKIHYSGKIIQNSQLHLGVFWGGRLEGAMQFGPSLDKKKIQPLVKDTGWNDFIELNRMAFSDILPRNSESRALSVAFSMIRKNYKNIEWVISFSDATQCGDGAIYRASGFLLTLIRQNTNCMKTERGGIVHKLTVETSKELMSKHGNWKKAMLEEYGEFQTAIGFQLRYIYFLNKEAKKRLTVPIIPFSRIDELGAGMYRGKPKRAKQAMDGDHPSQRQGGTDPHAPLKLEGVK